MMNYFLAQMMLVAFRSSYVLELLFCGAVGLLGIFTFLFYIRSRELLYLYYFLFLVFSFLAAYINVFEYDWENDLLDFSSGFARKNLELVTLLGLFAYCLFTLKLLDVKTQDAKLNAWIVGLAFITFLYAALYWIFYQVIAPYETTFFIVSRLIILPMSLIAIIGVSYRIQSDFKIFFILGSIFYLAGALIGVLRETVSGISFPYFYGLTASAYFYCGIFLEIICFTLALSHRVFLIYQRQKKTSENLKKRALYERDLAMVKVLGSQSQTNPHFIFNQFSVLKYLIQRKENDRAIKLLTSYSRFIRQILDLGIEQEITLKQELDILKQYLQLEALRMESRFSYAFKIDPELDLEKIYLPPIILQPFVERLIWRDFQLAEPQEKQLVVGIVKREQQIAIEVCLSAEKGNCRKIKNSMTAEGRHAINNERIGIYNRSHKHKINVYRDNQTDGKGMLSAILLAFFIDIPHI